MFRTLFLLTFLSLAIAATQTVIDERSFPSHHIITKDVAIIGGGAAGTYAAVRLREDLNTSVVLIEPQNRLGGHVQTYMIPGTNRTIEYGVQSYVPYGRAVEFFKRFGIETAPFVSRRLTTINVNGETGKALTGYTPPSSNATTEAFQRWLKIVEKYESLVDPGYWNFPPPDSIPADFLTPFGEFAKKHSLEAAAPRIMVISNIGVGGLKKVLTLHVIQAFGVPTTRSLLDGTFFAPVGSNSLVYQRAYDLLKPDVFLSTSLIETERDTSCVRLVVKNKDGEHLIKAKRVVYTPAPSRVSNLERFDEDRKETEVFNPWVYTWSFVGIAKIPCIPENYSVAYIAPAAVPDDHVAVREMPYTLRFDSTGPIGLGLFRVLFAANYSFTHDEAKEFAAKKVQQVVDAGTLNFTGECKVDYQAFVDHNSVLWPQTAEALKDGFVQKLYELEGYRSTWWTGERWSAGYSSGVWAFTETVMERLLKDIKKQ